MYAVVLAGGKGERLRPFTEDRPKPMVEIMGVPRKQPPIQPPELCGRPWRTSGPRRPSSGFLSRRILPPPLMLRCNSSNPAAIMRSLSGTNPGPDRGAL